MPWSIRKSSVLTLQTPQRLQGCPHKPSKNKQTNKIKQSGGRGGTSFLNCGICCLSAASLLLNIFCASTLKKKNENLSSQSKIPRHHLNILQQAGLILFSFSKGNCHLERNFLVLQTLRLQLTLFFFPLKQRFFQ